MVKNRIKTYWLLLLVMLYTASAAMSVGQSYAHYDNTVAASTLLEPSAQGMTSDCLVKKNEPALTVLVGELPLFEASTVTFWLKSCGADAAGKLAWTVSEPEHMQYLQITMKSGPQTIQPEDEIELMKDISMDISMVLRPTELARSTVHDVLKINVLVTWGEEMWGAFQVILPEVVEEETEVQVETDETEDPEAPSEENGSMDPEISGPDDILADIDDGTLTGIDNDTLTNADDGTLTGTGDDTLAGIDDGMLTGTDDGTQMSSIDTTLTDTNEEASDSDSSGEITDGIIEGQEETLDADDTIENDNTENGEISGEETGDTTDEETEQTDELQDASIQMKTLSRFDPSEALPVKIAVSEDVTSIRLGLQKTEEEETSLVPFPDRTRFSLNQGESYYMMYDGYVAEFALQDLSSLALLMDFSQAELKTEEEIPLLMEAYRGDELVKTCVVSSKPDAMESCFSLVHPLDVQTEAVVFTAGDTREAAAEYQAYGWPSRTLSHNNALEFTLPMEWLDAELEYSVDMLTMTEYQTLEYVPVTLSSSGLSGRYMDYDLTHNLVFRVGDILPRAGTYRLNMKWSYEGICFAQTQTTFFINYSAQTAFTLGSQEVSQ